MESLFELWGKRNPEWEKRYQSTIMDVFTDYGKGVNQYQDIRGKIFGAGYEIYIIAFFIGLYYNQTKPLVDDKAKRKVLGQAIMYWGNVENRLGRNSYGKIREYMFAALIAKTDVDLIALDKGEITARSVVDQLITKMEQYANFGFDYIEEQLENDPNYFFKESAFLRVFTSFLSDNSNDTEETDDEPDSLDGDEPDSLDVPMDEEQNEDNDSVDEEMLRAEAEKAWNVDDIDRLKLYFENDMELSKIAERLKKSLYSVQFQLSKLGLIRMPLNVTVRNSNNEGAIVNKSGEKVYSDEAPLKIIEDRIFRFKLQRACFTVKEVKRINGEWVKSGKMLVAHTDSDLYSELSASTLIDDIEDFFEGETREENRIKVNGTWYDYYGDLVSNKRRVASPTTTVSSNIQSVISNKRWSAAERRELQSYYESGMSTEKLASFFGTTEGNVIEVLKKLKIYR